MPTRFRIRILGRADGRPSEHSGAWIAAADADSHNGRGSMRSTVDPAAAMTFGTYRDGWAFWQAQSGVRPLRPDGRPNRPLTAYTVVVEPIGRPS